MNPDDPVDRYFAALAERTGTPPIGGEEADAVLRLAKVVAHTGERRFAPLAAYVAGLAIGSGASPADVLARTRRVDEVTAAARELGRRDDAAG